MADLIFPPSLAPRRVTWTLERNVATYLSPFSYTTQRNDQGRSARWRASIEMPPLSADEAGLLSSWLDQISRGEHVGLVPAFQSDDRGVESGLPQFKSLNLPWNEQPSLSAWSYQGLVTPPYVNGGNLVLRANTLTPTPEFRRTFTAIAGLPYAFRVYVPPQRFPAGFVIGNSAFTQVYFDNRSSPSVGLLSGLVTSNNSGITIAFTSPNAFQAAIYGSFVISRSYIAQSAASAGSNSIVINGSDPANQSPVNIVRTLKPGQFAMVRANGKLELKRCVAAVDCITGQSINSVATAGSGDFVFEPSLRGAVSTGAEIVSDQPVCRMRLATPESTAVVDAPNFSGFTFDMVEDIAP